MVFSVTAVLSVATPFINAYGAWAVTCIGSYATWRVVGRPLWNLRKASGPLLEVAEILQGKNIERHTQDAPRELKELSSKFYLALQKWKSSPEESKQIAKKALGVFFSLPDYENCIQLNGWFSYRSKRILLDSLSNLYQKLSTLSDAESEKLLISCSSVVQEVITKQQGALIRIKEMGKSVFSQGMKHVVERSKKLPYQINESQRHSLEKLRTILARPTNPLNVQLICFHLKYLGLTDVRAEDLPGKLDSFVKAKVHQIQTEDFKGFKTVCTKQKLDPYKVLSNGVQQDIDSAFIAYEQMRKLKPKLPPQSTLPEELRWKETTNYEHERTKSLDLVSSFSIFIFFNQRYCGDAETKAGFYHTLARCHSLSPSERKREVLAFFKSERKRIGGSWIPWAIDRYIFDSVYCTVKETISQCLADTPFLTNIRLQLKDSPVPAIVRLGEKSARYFYYLTQKYAEWSKNYAYDMGADSFLEKKLYKRQEHAQGHLNLDFFLSRYNLVYNLQYLSNALSKWASSSSFHSNSFLSTLNPAFLFVKHLGMALPRLAIQLLKIPAIFLQLGLDKIYMYVVEQVLVHTKLLEKVDELVTDAILKPSPYLFPILEVLLSNLQEISETIDKASSEDIPFHTQNNRAKRALQETFRNFVKLAKKQESIDTTNDSNEQLLFEKILPFATDKIFETMLKIHKAYKDEADFDERKVEYLQALNFYVYKKHTVPENEEALLQRHEKVKEQIAFYMRKIIRSLVDQISKEELSTNIRQFIENLLSQVKGTELSPLKKSYVERKKAIIVDLLKKPYVMKGLFLHLITQDKNL